MRKSLLLSVLFLLLAAISNAQNKPCSTDESFNELLEIKPSIKGLREIAENQARAFRAAGKNYDAVVTIPVVVHILWNISPQNLADSQIFSQIDVINEDFRKMNADTSVIRSIFAPLAGDSRIQFCLAQRDPQGNPSSGITRTYTPVTGFSCNDQMKFDTTGGKTAWDPSRYLNIWVCNLGCANGYAYYPGIPAQYDGVVVHYYVFGVTGYVAPGYLGRTATHEIGHWLGLYHPFFYNNYPCEGNSAFNCATLGDKICDTPKDSTPTWDCDPLLNTCTDSPTDLPDMYENFMDYTSDGCRVMFTHEQIERMHSFLYTSRVSLLTSSGCIPADSSYYDACAVGIAYPGSEICQNTFSPVVQFGNGSTEILTSLTIDVKLDGSQQGIYSWTGNLSAGDFTNYTIPALNSVPGSHIIEVTLKNPNGQPDQYSGNDKTIFSFVILGNNDGDLMPLFEGFESVNWPPAGWFTNNPVGDFEWELNAAVGGYGNSSSSAYFPNSSSYQGGASADLITPWLNLTSCGAAVLYFDRAYSKPDPNYLPLYSDTLIIYYSTNCTQNWIRLWERGGDDLATAPPVIPFIPFVPGVDEWKTDTIDLSSVCGNALVQLRFENRSYFGNDLFLDNINIDWPSGIDGSIYQAAWIYPTLLTENNPLHVRLTGTSFAEIKIINIYGQVLFSKNLSDGDNSLNPEIRTTGVYIYRITDNGKTISTGKILIM